MTLKERLMQPTSGLPFEIGRGVVLGASAFGMGALAFYGMGLSNQASALDNSFGWSQLVRDRIHTSYAYLGAGLASTVASSVLIFRSPTLISLASRGSLTAMLVTMAAVWGSSILVHALPYSEGFGPKQMAFLGHTALIGGVLAPLAFLGGAIVLRAAVYTAGIVGGLSTIAVCAPSERFLSWGAPLGIGLGAVFAANLGAMFLPPTSALGAGLASVAIYGGLVLFSAFLLYDTQRLIKKAETHPTFAVQPFDPINASMSVYMDIINIFVRIVYILGMGGNRKK